MSSSNADDSGLKQRSSSEDSTTLDGPTPETAQGYSAGPYFAPIGEGIKKHSDDDIVEEQDPGLRRIATYMEDEHRQELHRIATAISANRPSMTRAEESFRTLSAIAEIPLNDPALNPQDPKFNLAKWIRVFMDKIQAEGHRNRPTGVVFKDMNVFGSGSALQLQATVGTMLTAPLRIGKALGSKKDGRKQILRSFHGHLNAGELLIVLGRPGSGCSTFLKTLTGQLSGLELAKETIIHFDGIPQQKIIKEFKGEATYNQEVDKHFPHLTVGQTLEFAAACRTASNRPMSLSREELSKHIAQVVMAVFGLSHTYNTKVGNDFVRGVSGGERKRVSIAEMAVGHGRFSAWDNSTRGLDSAGALNFVRSLRTLADLTGQTSAVAIYQASQAIYDLFEKATVLYEGRQIYFGPADRARAYFEKQGWYCPPRQTTGDFLTSVTNPTERKPIKGMENKVPRTPEDFEQYWLNSEEYQELQRKIAAHEDEFPYDAEGTTAAKEFQEEKVLSQAKHVRPNSPFIISIWMQIRLCTKRGYQRIWGDISAQATNAFVNVVMALIIGSIFYGSPDATVSFYSRGSVLFLGVLMNALTAISEINSLYDQRPIVEKHNSYAFYHPWTEAAAGVVADLPVKFVIAVVFNVILYFLSGLRREPAQFFLYFLIIYIITFVMSAIFRTLAAVTKTVSQAMALSGVMVLALVIYTGFAITVPTMHPWFSWIRWINPLFYAFEILVSNEFHGREFTCSSRIPAYSPSIGDSWICSTVGAVAGRDTVSGDAFIYENYRYSYSHVWRNFGILIGFLIAFMVVYFVAVELNSNTASAAEQLVFPHGKVPAHLQPLAKGAKSDEEAPNAVRDANIDGSSNSDVKAIPPQKDIFTWKDVVYDIEIKGEPRRLLDHVAGYVRPGTLTALMGVSGAGKTTLLDVLAHRTTMGVITGDMLVNGHAQDSSFQRKTGYVQQQDLHLETATVRESLRFSAMLRQPKTVSKEDKYQYVEDVIDMLNMREFADAIVGVPGQGLNVEQRKLLTIGVELAAKPKLLLFLDEPTSGLDSQSSWAICAFLRKLADSGQAILCTIHQPSAILFQQFDRLLFLAKGGKTVYFGPIGENSRTLLDYFEANGARKCDNEENPAEYMLEIVNKGTNDQDENWYDVWNNSANRQTVLQEIEQMHDEKRHEPAADDDASSSAEFAMPFMAQLNAVTVRIFQQYFRMPSYIFAKWALAVAAGLFIGFSFYRADGTLAGTQNVIFSVFMLTTIFSSMVQQIQPLFVTQRSLYEVRERPSKAYSWKAFMIANIVVEIPYQVITGILAFACYYYAVNGVQDSLRQGLVLLYVISLFIFGSTFAHMTIAALPDAQTAAAIVTALMIMMTLFNGVLQSPAALPGFWIFMYRVSPFTYWVGGIVATQVHQRAITCSRSELSIFNPPSGKTCGEYLAPYLARAPGHLQNPSATTGCEYCSLSNADQYVGQSDIFWSQKWRNYGIIWAFIVFNAFIAVLTYWLFRVREGGITLPSFAGGSKKKEQQQKKKEDEMKNKERKSHFNILRQ